MCLLSHIWEKLWIFDYIPILIFSLERIYEQTKERVPRYLQIRERQKLAIELEIGEKRTT